MSASKRNHPVPSSAQVSAFMSAQRTLNTQPELALRRALHRRGVRFRLHRVDLPGRPDVVLVRLHLAVFIDGCFWHRCPLHGSVPRHNRDWWAAKLAATVERDRRNDDLLRQRGWNSVHVWEHEDPDVVADVLANSWFSHQ